MIYREYFEKVSERGLLMRQLCLEIEFRASDGKLHHAYGIIKHEFNIRKFCKGWSQFIDLFDELEVKPFFGNDFAKFVPSHPDFSLIKEHPLGLIQILQLSNKNYVKN